MATGQQTFRGDTATEVHEAILHRTPAPAREITPELPAKLEEIIGKALEKDREVRYQTALEMRADLKGLQTDIASKITRGTFTSRWRWPLVAAISLAVFLVAGIFITRWMGKVSNPSFERQTFDRGSIYNARFTPDGNTIVYSAAWDGRPPQIFWTRPGSRTSSPLGLGKAELLAISAKGEVAALLSPYIVEGGGAHAGTLVVVPLTGGAPREILDNVGGADFSPSGDLAVVHYAENRTRCRLEFPIGKVLYESDYALVSFIANVRVSPRGDRIAFIEAPLAASKVAVVDLVGRKTILSEPSIAVDGIAWSGDGSEIWFSGEGPGGHGIYAVTLAGKQRLILREPEALALQDVSSEGRFLGMHTTAHEECRVHLPGYTNERDFTWLANSDCKAIAADGKTVLLQTDEGVYIRGIDASAPVRLGDGFALALAPEGKYVLSLVPYPSPKLVLLPTGLGDARPLPRGQIEIYDPEGAKWLPDVHEIVFVAREKGHDLKAYVQDIAGGPPRAITPEKRFAYSPPGLAISPDGKFVIFTTGSEDRFLAYPIEGGEPRAVAGLTQGDRPIVWSADSRSLFVRKIGATGEVYLVNIETGKRQLWKTFMPPDPAGVDGVVPVLSPDGRFYAYSYGRNLSDLYSVGGVK